MSFKAVAGPLACCMATCRSGCQLYPACSIAVEPFVDVQTWQGHRSHLHLLDGATTNTHADTSSWLLVQAAKTNATKSVFGFFRRGSDPVAEAPTTSPRAGAGAATIPEEQAGASNNHEPSATAVTRNQALTRIGGWLSSTATTAGACYHCSTYVLLVLKAVLRVWHGRSCICMACLLDC